VTAIYTFGHSTMSGDDFTRILSQTSITTAIDVRRVPGSRRHPQFDQSVVSQLLRRDGILYVHLPELGGRRTPRADSANRVWRQEAFRGYADYMETDEFREALAEALRHEPPLAFFCAESLWWKCHRRLIADALVAAGHAVRHIASSGATTPHALTTGAQIVDGKIRYDGGQRRLV
jgi:uncharacterized protein (DUF488 family)